MRSLRVLQKGFRFHIFVLNFIFMEYHGRITQSIISWQEDIDESPETETEEAEDLFPNIDEDPVPNIDEGDEGNPFAVTEYIEDMSMFYCETEVIIWSFESTLTYVDVNPFGLLVRDILFIELLYQNPDFLFCWMFRAHSKLLDECGPNNLESN